MRSGGKRRKCPKRLSFKPNRRSPWSRSAPQWPPKVARRIVLADVAYGINTEFRDGLTGLGLQYTVGVQSWMTVWEPGKQPLPAKPGGKTGRPPRLLRRTADHQPISVKQLAFSLPSSAFKEITWREGSQQKLRSRFAAIEVRPAHRDYWKAEPHAEEWLLIEWREEKQNPQNIGYRRCRLARNSEPWSRWQSTAGSSRGTTRS